MKLLDKNSGKTIESTCQGIIKLQELSSQDEIVTNLVGFKWRLSKFVEDYPVNGNEL